MTQTDTAVTAPAHKLPAWLDRLTPRTGVTPQLYAAAMMWLIGCSILLVRGVLFLHDRWFPAIVGVAIVIGLIKERYILNRYARKAVARIRARGKACFFGFFGWSSWLFIAVMMGGGILLRHSGLWPDLLGVIYVAVGTGLLMADRIFWQAALGRLSDEPPAENPGEGAPAL